MVCLSSLNLLVINCFKYNREWFGGLTQNWNFIFQPVRFYDIQISVFSFEKMFHNTIPFWDSLADFPTRFLLSSILDNII